MSKKKLGLSLSGGGARGVAHVGFLKALEDGGIKPDVVSGCSIGAVVGGCYCAGVTLDEMKSCLTRLTKKDLLDVNFNLLNHKSIFAGKKMRSLLQKYVGRRDIESLDVTYGCIATDLISGSLVNLVDGDLVSAILASASIPTVFAPVERDGCLLVDGGVLLRNPVKLAKDLGADVIVAVDVLGKLNKTPKVDKIIDVGMRTFSVIDNVFCSKLGTKMADLVIYPPVRDVKVFNFENLASAYQSGYEEGVSRIGTIKALIA